MHLPRGEATKATLEPQKGSPCTVATATRSVIQHQNARTNLLTTVLSARQKDTLSATALKKARRNPTQEETPKREKERISKKRKAEEEEEENGEHSMMMLTLKVTKDGTLVDCALHAKIAKQNGKNPAQQQPWIMD